MKEPPLDLFHHLRVKFHQVGQIRHYTEQLREKRGGEVLWFTSGVFDMFHLGHMWLLNKAVQEATVAGAALLVAVNSEESCKLYKGRKPVWPLHARMLAVANIDFVQFVVSFDEPNPSNLIRALRPDVIVHGTSRSQPAFMRGTELAGFTGRVVKYEYPPELGDWSTSSIKQICYEQVDDEIAESR